MGLLPHIKRWVRPLLSACLILTTAALNDADPQAHGTYFISPNTTTYPQIYVFALNVVPVTGDVFFHMSAYAATQSTIPAFSWMGVGFGAQMKDAFMLIAYPSANGTGLTLSPRLARGHSEPEFQRDVAVEKIFSDSYAPAANTVQSGIMIAHGVCRNCTSWTTGALDLSSERQPFIFALGADPGKGQALQSDDPAAGLHRHSFYGRFEADMSYAVSAPEHARVPPPNDPGGSPSGVADTNFAYAFASEAFDTREDSEWAPALHGVLMSLAFVLVFPLGALLMRLLRRMGFVYHAGVQAFGIALVVVGFAAGVYASKQYVRSRSFASAHQGIGLIIFAALVVQAGLGLMQHRVFRRTKRETPMGVVHRFLGPVIIVLAIVNGGLGLDFAGNAHYTVAYGVVVAVIGSIVAGIVGLDIFWRRPKKYQPEQEWPGRKPGGEDQTAFLTMDTPVSAYEMTWMKKDDVSRRDGP